MKKQMDANYFGSASIAHAAINAWLEGGPSSEKVTLTSREPRHIIFTTSFLALLPIAGYAAYSPTKAALRSLADTLNMELKLYEGAGHIPISVHTVFPATIYSAGFENEQKIKSDLTKKLEEGDEGQTPEKVAQESISGLERGEEYITTTFLTRLVKGTMLGAGRRSGLGIVDTLLAWVMSVAMVFVRGDLVGKVETWGKTHGASGMKK
jgi:3-dehydrosphinganine reductase